MAAAEREERRRVHERRGAHRRPDLCGVVEQDDNAENYSG